MNNKLCPKCVGSAQYKDSLNEKVLNAIQNYIIDEKQ